ncbi:EamA family transporter [Streptomyces sp. WMMC500]|uniref:EamA family transporter n=1 Tax=Streptomyces sp. WMMC500 TaxID=3015154 RepID=UPI00248CD64C|nr:EamA family transporter [Streptomyces sp. WMMC500]WBB63200.1 EamA family transporter [Streptomyces sp. WMMC500]
MTSQSPGPAASASPAPSAVSAASAGAPAAGAVPAEVPAAGVRAGRLGGVALVVSGSLSTQFGAAVAALLFPRAGALGVVTLRLALSAVVLMLVFRPRLRGHTRGDWAVLCGFGFALGAMNTVFYQAIERIPLGPAVTLEVLGPLALSVLTNRRAASLLWAALALGGVVLLSGGGFGGLDPVGVACALGAGSMWAAYIVLSARAGARFPRADGLAIAMSVAAVISVPIGVASAGSKLVEPVTLGLGLAVAVLSSGLPYALDQFALRRLPAATFALMMSLAPALAALAGFLVLDQGLTVVQCAAIGMVIAASIGAVRTPPRPAARRGSP